MLGIARALVAMGWRGRGPVAFVSHTAEGSGQLDDDFPWCAGAWHQVAVARPRWGGEVPFFLNVEASASRSPAPGRGPAGAVRRFASRIFRAAARAGRLQQGWVPGRRSPAPRRGSFSFGACPGERLQLASPLRAQQSYHTTNDVPGHGRASLLADLTSLYTEVLISRGVGGGPAPRPSRPRPARRRGGGMRSFDLAPLARAASAYELAGSRAAFVRLARSGLAVDAGGDTGYLHVQATADARNLESALRCLEAGDRTGAARAAVKVGDDHLVEPLAGGAPDRPRPRASARFLGGRQPPHPQSRPDRGDPVAPRRARGAAVRGMGEAVAARCPRPSGAGGTAPGRSARSCTLVPPCTSAGLWKEPLVKHSATLSALVVTALIGIAAGCGGGGASSSSAPSTTSHRGGR